MIEAAAGIVPRWSGMQSSGVSLHRSEGEGSGVRALRVLGRYLAGTALVAVLVVAGVVLHIVQVGHQDQRAGSDAIVVLGAAQYNGRPSAVYAAGWTMPRSCIEPGSLRTS